MHNTINVWYGNWQKVCMKRSRRKDQAKKGWSSTFLKEPLEFLGLLFQPWKFWTKESFIPGNYMTSLKII